MRLGDLEEIIRIAELIHVADDGQNAPYPVDPSRPAPNSSPGGLPEPPAPPDTQVTGPTSPYMGGWGQGPGSWAQAGQNMFGDPRGWVGLQPGNTSIGGSGSYDVGQGDQHPATVPYPAQFP